MGWDSMPRSERIPTRGEYAQKAQNLHAADRWLAKEALSICGLEDLASEGASGLDRISKQHS